jgi:alpha-D-xyloside xylohydrolase
VVMLVKDGAVIPHVRLAQSTAAMDWREIELMVFSAEASGAEGSLCLPEEGQVHSLHLEREGDEDDFALKEDPLRGRVEWKIRIAPAGS